ncbi:MAG: EF-hand domain-containing protein [Sphingobacteriales bacterium JAD_PAG50586_3]|nr:MAG: EF-hand domain-containing protein [Sphingobacteriales bacterium JAD_PAG50586_3]
MKKTLLIVLLAGLTTASTYAETAAKPAKIKFKKIDANRDGLISKTEAQKSFNKVVIDNFDAMDTGKDNYISKKEFKAYMKKQK